MLASKNDGRSQTARLDPSPGCGTKFSEIPAGARNALYVYNSRKDSGTLMLY